MILDLSMYVFCNLVHDIKLCLVCGVLFFFFLLAGSDFQFENSEKESKAGDSNSIILFNFVLHQWGCNIYLNLYRFVCVPVILP